MNMTQVIQGVDFFSDREKDIFMFSHDRIFMIVPDCSSITRKKNLPTV